MNCVPIILARSLLRPHEVSSIPTTSPSASTGQNQQTDGDGCGSSPRSPHEDDGSRLSSPNSPSNGANTSSICFQVPPQHRVFISLSKLNAKLAENYAVAYPMLQYLDAYVCELNKFLTEQPVLLGAYMAVKLTEPPSNEELMQVCSNLNL